MKRWEICLNGKPLPVPLRFWMHRRAVRMMRVLNAMEPGWLSLERK